jgi:hypothetical protein
MSSILKRPGWANFEPINERVKIGDYDKVVPGWGPGKEAKRFFMGKEGEQVPTGRLGAMRPVGKTAYREAELAFSRYLATSLEIAESVIATKEVKQILKDFVTIDKLQEKGYDSVDEWIQGWVEFAQEKFGMDLTNVRTQRERAVRDAVQDVAQEIEDEVPEEGEPEEAAPEPEMAAAPEGTPLTPELKARISGNAVKPQSADASDDGTKWNKISFMGQNGDNITYVYLKDVPKNRENVTRLKGIRSVGDALSSPELSPYISSIELERNGVSKKYTVSPEEMAAPEMPAAAPEMPRREARPIDLELGESAKPSIKERAILTEQMRIARKQHLQRIEERYRY